MKNPNTLSRLVYYSKSTCLMSLEEMDELLRKSNENNIRNGVTGALYYNEKYFLQVLEGGKEDINLTFSKILKDDRHTDIVIRSIDPIDCRYFEDWSMRYLDTRNSVAQDILKYSLNSKRDIDGMTFNNILELFQCT